MTKKNPNLSALGERIAHKSAKQATYKKFEDANEILGIVDEEPRESVVRKSYALTKQDVEKIQHIKEKGLNKRIVLSDSQVIRIGIKLVTDLSEAELVKEAEQIPKLLAGRPKKR